MVISGQLKPLRLHLKAREENMSTQASNPSKTNTCAHPACNCPVEPGKQYCSDACAKAPDKGLAATDCNCNHPNCAMAA